MIQKDLNFLRSMNSIKSSNIYDAVETLIRLNKVAKMKNCKKDLKDNIYYFKYQIANWLYQNKYCVASKYIYSTSDIVCKNCKGTGQFFNTITLVEKECPFCKGGGYKKNIFLAMKFKIKNISFLWHIPKKVSDKYGFTESHPGMIEDHSIEKREYEIDEVY